ncbi:Hypothetical predicted protein [Mytilus galloprovincialis]|uniref:Uncharacterized protein n=1 Tax=Mytilus galloprovincialis TaxID=29158 RepID=A0A8B6FY33_MYTGA|nr:Hypothetical predicted protein [Mytilus galloprovincialis]
MNNQNHQAQFNKADQNFMYQHGPSFPLSQQYFCSSPTTGMYPPPSMQHVSPITQSQISQQRPPLVDEIFRRMDKFQEKLDKLEQIDSIVTSINAKVIRLEQGTKSLDDRMEQVERCSQHISDNYDKHKCDLTELKTEVNNISKSLKTNSKEVKNVGHEFRSSLSDMKKENDKLKESFLDVQMKSMSNNLIFYNIPETEVENCPDIILDFCKNTMKLENSDQIQLSDAHRIGRKGGKTRPMLAKFSSYVHRELVRKNAKTLKNSSFGISEQLPTDVQNRRKELLPLMKELRDQNVKAYFVRDKIHVGGQEYKP